MISKRIMSATIRSSQRIRRAELLPELPLASRPARSSELKEIESFIRAAGGKPMSQATKRRLARAGCLGMPQD